MDKTKLQNYIIQGLSQRQIAEKENISQTGLRYWLKKYNIKTAKDKRVWDDKQLIASVASSKYMSDVIIKLGLTVRPGNYETLRKHIKRLDLDTSHFIGNSSQNKRGGPKEIANEKVFVKDSIHSRSLVKSRIIKYRLLDYECNICELTEWNGKRLVLVLDHINGINNDHRLQNLRFLCPNCHSQQKETNKPHKYASISQLVEETSLDLVNVSVRI